MSTDQQRQRPGVIGRVVTWLRAGYPEGVPTGDYVALLGVLRRRLREEEIQEIVERLAAQRELDLTPDRIHELIRDYSLQEPHEADIARVTALLASTGYPVLDDDETVGDESEPPDPTGDDDGSADEDQTVGAPTNDTGHTDGAAVLPDADVRRDSGGEGPDVSRGS